MQLQFSTVTDCPPRYPFRFTTRNTLSRAHERRLSEPPKKTTATTAGSLSLARALTLALSYARVHARTLTLKRATVSRDQWQCEQPSDRERAIESGLHARP